MVETPGLEVEAVQASAARTHPKYPFRFAGAGLYALDERVAQAVRILGVVAEKSKRFRGGVELDQPPFGAQPKHAARLLENAGEVVAPFFFPTRNIQVIVAVELPGKRCI